MSLARFGAIVAPAPPRLKWPAYAKRLFEQRAKGRHPLRVDVFLGMQWPNRPLTAARDDWPWHPQMDAIPYIGIPVGEYAPGAFDLRVLAGVAVKLHYGDGVPDLQGWPAEQWLGGDCARVAAHLNFDRGETTCISILAQSLRYIPTGEPPRFVWPPWWSDELQRSYRARSNAWFARWERSLREYNVEANGRPGVRGLSGRRDPAAYQVDPWKPPRDGGSG